MGSLVFTVVAIRGSHSLSQNRLASGSLVDKPEAMAQVLVNAAAGEVSDGAFHVPAVSDTHRLGEVSEIRRILTLP
jgi:hypothetical protein